MAVDLPIFSNLTRSFAGHRGSISMSGRFHLKLFLWASVQNGYQLPQNPKDYASEISGWRFRASP